MEKFKLYVNDRDVTDAVDDHLTEKNAARIAVALLTGQEPGTNGRVDVLSDRGRAIYETARSWVVDIDGKAIELPIVVFAPCSVDSQTMRDRPVVVVRRPALRSHTGQTTGHVDERLSISVEAYAADGPTECLGVDELEKPVYGGPRVPVRTQIVWCTKDERDRWDQGSGGSPGNPRSGSSNEVAAYLDADAEAVEEATLWAKAAITPLPPHVARLVRQIAPVLREKMAQR